MSTKSDTSIITLQLSKYKARAKNSQINNIFEADYSSATMVRPTPRFEGDTIVVKKAVIDDKVLLKFDSEDNKTYAILEFSYSL